MGPHSLGEPWRDQGSGGEEKEKGKGKATFEKERVNLGILFPIRQLPRTQPRLYSTPSSLALEKKNSQFGSYLYAALAAELPGFELIPFY